MLLAPSVTLSTYFWINSLRSAKLFSGRPRSSSKSLRQAFMVRLLQTQNHTLVKWKGRAGTACCRLDRYQQRRTHSRFDSICFRRCLKASFRVSSLTLAMVISSPAFWRLPIYGFACAHRQTGLFEHHAHVPDLSSQRCCAVRSFLRVRYFFAALSYSPTGWHFINRNAAPRSYCRDSASYCKSGRHSQVTVDTAGSIKGSKHCQMLSRPVCSVSVKCYTIVICFSVFRCWRQ